MNIISISHAPLPAIASALEEFEQVFQYPLGEHDTFRISHGHDYARFFRAMGEGICFAAEHKGKILGTISLALRTLKDPQGKSLKVVYVGDLKVVPEARGFGTVTISLIRAAIDWSYARGAVAAYGVVMEGTKGTPEKYTGRLGVPSAVHVGKVVVLRIPTSTPTHDGEASDVAGVSRGVSARIVPIKDLNSAYSRLSARVYAALGGRPSLRSKFKPLPMVSQDGSACALLEDTLKAKRLISSSGDELLSAHLSRFAFDAKRPEGAMEVMRTALSVAAQRGFPAMFVAVDEIVATELHDQFALLNAVRAPANVYGVSLKSSQSWLINTAEI